MKRVKLLEIRQMKPILTLLFFCVSVAGLNAQLTSKGDSHNTNQNVVIKIEGNNDAPQGTNTSISGTENVSFYGTSDGIYVTINSGTNKIKLFALTGQLLFNGDLTQGRFKIQTLTGIYFLKINNKNFKVICK